MNIERIAGKLKTMAEGIAIEGRSLDLLGLFLRDNSPGLLWDVVIAEPGLRSGILPSYRRVAADLRAYLDPDERASISTIVILDQESSALKSFQERFRGLTGPTEVNFETEGGAVVTGAYPIVVGDVDLNSSDKPTSSDKPSRHTKQTPRKLRETA